MPVPVSSILYREFLLGSTGSMSRTHEMRGGGVPTAEHSKTALWPISTTFVLGACVICGNPAGSLSAETQRDTTLMKSVTSYTKFIGLDSWCWFCSLGLCSPWFWLMLLTLRCTCCIHFQGQSGCVRFVYVFGLQIFLLWVCWTKNLYIDEYSPILQTSRLWEHM
jgi:hypothetical protein